MYGNVRSSLVTVQLCLVKSSKCIVTVWLGIVWQSKVTVERSVVKQCVVTVRESMVRWREVK